MARPKLGGGDTERVQLVITPKEIEAIETWRYNSRVPSKSEAIRRLCQVGLAYHKHGNDTQRRTERALRAALMALDNIGSDAPPRMRGGLVVVLQELVAANKAAVSAMVAASVIEDGKDTRDVDNLMSVAEALIAKLGEEPVK